MRVLVCASNLALLCLAVLPTALGAQYTISQKIANPSYFVPGSLWNQLNNSAPSVGIAVANVMNGPDYQPYSNYTSAIQSASAAGIRVLGYVRTGYLGTTGFTTRLGQTDPTSWLAQIEQDVNAWYSFYGNAGIGGIFLDEGQNACGANNSYANTYAWITAYIKQNHPGALVAVNPGTAVPSCFQGTADVILTFEGTYLCYIQDSSCPAGQPYVPLAWNPVDPNAIWHLIYNTGSGQYANASSLAKTRGAGFFYITSDTLPNPWDTLPTGTDWSGEQANAAPAGGDTTPPSIPTGLSAPASGLGYTSVVLNWNLSTDTGSGVVAYDVYRGQTWLFSTPANTTGTQSATVTGLQPNTPYTFSVTARDASGNISGASSGLTVTTQSANGAPPTAPGNLAASSIAYAAVTLSWTASNDSLGISAYDVFKQGTKILTLTGSTTSIFVGGLSPGTNYTFTVQARDPQGNVSPASTTNVSTQALPEGWAIYNPWGVYTDTLTYGARFYLPFGFQHVFIDLDNNINTGWITSSDPPVGADYVIENTTLYKYAGTGNDWTWTAVATVTPVADGYTMVWTLPVSDFINPTSKQTVVFEGNGSSPTAYSVVSVVKQTSGAVSDPSGTYTASNLTYRATFSKAWPWLHVFIDSDNNAATGWITASGPAVGADYMIENGSLYHYAGSGADWTWSYLGSVTPAVNGATDTWTIPLSDIANPQPTQTVVFEGNGPMPTAYSDVITLVRDPSGMVMLSGQVTSGGAALPGVTLTLTGSSSMVTTTDANGLYSFLVPAGGSYTVRPSLGANTFNPPFAAFTNLTADQTANLSMTPTLLDVDVPTPQAVYSGSQTLHGWAFDTANGIASVNVSVDGSPAVNATYGSSRPDACSAYGLSAPCPNIGWSLPFDTTTLTNGLHTFVITSTTTDQVPRQNSRIIVCIIANASVTAKPALAPNLPKKEYMYLNGKVAVIEGHP